MHLSHTLDILEKMLTGLQLSLEDFDFFLKAGATSANKLYFHENNMRNICNFLLKF